MRNVTVGLVRDSIIFATVGLCGFFAHAQDYVEGEIIVKLKGQSGSQASYAFLGKASSKNRMNLKRSWHGMNMHHFSVKPGQKVHDAIREIESDPDVEYAEPNYIISKSVHQFSHEYSAQEVSAMSGSYLATGAAIQATDLWGTFSSSNPKPVVAVIDTGLDINHTVFNGADAIWTNDDEIPGNGLDDDGNGYVDDVNGWNFVANSGFMYDDDGHGTHVSGIVLGVGQDIYNSPFDNSLIKIMPLKFLDGNGVGKTSDAIQAIYYAINNGARVLNNSWGGPNYSAALHEAVAYTYSYGAVFVAAAGNAGSNNDSAPMYPASYNVPNVISIAATTDSDYLASFSNYGIGSVQLGSPGVFILSTIPGNVYGTSSGTSMAAPFVAGVAALMKVESPNMLGYQIKSIILDESDTVAPLVSKVSTESRVNVTSSVNQAKVASVDLTQPAYSFTNGDRELASAIAGGCGTVAKFYRNMNGGGPGGSGPGGLNTWYIIVVMGLLSLPFVMAHYMRQDKPASRRKHDRFVIDTGVKVKVGERELVANVSSISQGGVQLNTEELLENGGIISMRITAPDGTEQLEVEGRVVWSEEKRAYGVQFANAGETVAQSIGNWTKNLTKAS